MSVAFGNLSKFYSVTNVVEVSIGIGVEFLSISAASFVTCSPSFINLSILVSYLSKYLFSISGSTNTSFGLESFYILSTIMSARGA